MNRGSRAAMESATGPLQSRAERRRARRESLRCSKTTGKPTADGLAWSRTPQVEVVEPGVPRPEMARRATGVVHRISCQAFGGGGFGICHLEAAVAASVATVLTGCRFGVSAGGFSLPVEDSGPDTLRVGCDPSAPSPFSWAERGEFHAWAVKADDHDIVFDPTAPRYRELVAQSPSRTRSGAVEAISCPPLCPSTT